MDPGVLVALCPKPTHSLYQSVGRTGISWPNLWAVQGMVVLPLHVLGGAKLLLFFSNAFKRNCHALLQHQLMDMCS